MPMNLECAAERLSHMEWSTCHIGARELEGGRVRERGRGRGRRRGRGVGVRNVQLNTEL